MCVVGMQFYRCMHVHVIQWRIQDFPLGGGGQPVGGGGGGRANLRYVHFLAKMYAKTKEIDPVGGAHAAAPPWIRQCVCINFNSGGGNLRPGWMFESE